MRESSSRSGIAGLAVAGLVTAVALAVTASRAGVARRSWATCLPFV